MVIAYFCNQRKPDENDTEQLSHKIIAVPINSTAGGLL